MAEAVLVKMSNAITSDDVTAMKEHVLSGYNTIAMDSDDEIVNGEMPDNGSVNKTLEPSETYVIEKGYHDGTGRVTAKTKKVELISAFSFKDSNSSDIEENVFVMPADGTVYYSGSSVNSNKNGTVVCEIYNNDILIDSCNVNSDSEATYLCMYNKSFDVSKDDMIKVVADTTLTETMALSSVQATIVYFL